MCLLGLGSRRRQGRSGRICGLKIDGEFTLDGLLSRRTSTAIYPSRSGANWRTLCSPNRNRKYEGCSSYSVLMMRAQVGFELG